MCSILILRLSQASCEAKNLCRISRKPLASVSNLSWLLQALCESAEVLGDECKPFANPPASFGAFASPLHFPSTLLSSLQAPCEAANFLRDVCKPLASPPTFLGTSSDIDFKEPCRKITQKITISFLSEHFSAKIT